MKNNPIFISQDLIDYIKKYRDDKDLSLFEHSMIADAMCGLEITISSMQADESIEGMLKTAMSVISSYYVLLEMIMKSE